MPGFLLNTATDTLLRKIIISELQKPHPFMERNGLGHLVPFKMMILRLGPVIAVRSGQL